MLKSARMLEPKQRYLFIFKRKNDEQNSTY
jgi:hypothetical protein